ncbi:MAG: T9SS type A sorting domain-containing protein [Paludibacter sp.]|nr:T9SS type A sorting domain-containing protein [Paludibacter sp.]
MSKSRITFILLFFAILIAKSQINTPVVDLPRPDAIWENEFQQRLNQMWGTRIPNYVPNPNSNIADGGKSEWPSFLAKLGWSATNNKPSTMASLISVGRQMINGANVGSFYKPFSCAGYAMYYFHWKDSISKYDPTQVQAIYQDVNRMWNYLIRQDHVFDACCGYNAGGGKEFNSENFHWMMRCTGYLFAHELHNKTVNGKVMDMTKMDMSLLPIALHTGLSSPIISEIRPSSVNLISYFDGFVNNLTRALYNSGRIEWNSNSYFGHTLSPLLTLYENADKCGDPNGLVMKKKAKACLDWMMVEAAIHYQDGFQAAADARAKATAFVPFHGSIYQYTIPFFADTDHYPTFSPSIWDTQDPGKMEIGFMLSSDYRPPTIVIDLAQRKFPLPVEIQSAKPFYHLDKGQYFNNDGTVKGEFPYNAWNGTGLGRRFEFETIWIDKNVTLSSAVVGRPDGSIGTYSEQGLWRLAVKGQHRGARMLCGNGGGMSATAGRSPYHEIGQYRNMMMQIVKNPSASSNQIWFVIPDSLSQLATTGESSFFDVQYYKWNGNDLYLNMGNNVYIALKPFPAPNTSITKNFSESTDFSKLSFSWPAGTMGSVVTEVGTSTDYNSFADFVTSLSSKTITKIDDSTYEYLGGRQNKIKLQFVTPNSFMMIPYTYDTPNPNPYTPAGTYPKVWGDDSLIDYQTWDSYKTVYGYDVLNQGWGSGIMTLKTQNFGARTTINPITAEVTYEVTSTNGIDEHSFNDSNSEIQIHPNPAKELVYIQCKEDVESVQIYTSIGELVKSVTDSKVIQIADLTKGIYFIVIHLKNGEKITRKIIKN